MCLSLVQLVVQLGIYSVNKKNLWTLIFKKNLILFSALLPENVERNRFKDVVPYDENRVRIMPDKVNSTSVVKDFSQSQYFRFFDGSSAA